MELADSVQRSLGRPATTKDLEQIAFAVIDGNDRRIRPLVRFEERLLEGLWPPGTQAQADKGTAGMVAALQALRKAVESGQPLRPALEDVELEMRAFIELRDRLIRVVKRQLTPAAIARIEDRFERYESQLARPVRDVQSLATK